MVYCPNSGNSLADRRHRPRLSLRDGGWGESAVAIGGRSEERRSDTSRTWAIDLPAGSPVLVGITHGLAATDRNAGQPACHQFGSSVGSCIKNCWVFGFQPTT